MDNKLKIIYKQTKDLKPYANNPRMNDDAVEYVANSIKEFGFKVPMVITSDGEIVAGHTRLKACERLGITEAMKKTRSPYLRNDYGRYRKKLNRLLNTKEQAR